MSESCEQGSGDLITYSYDDVRDISFPGEHLQVNNIIFNMKTYQ